jgi:hypothetical protein
VSESTPQVSQPPRRSPRRSNTWPRRLAAIALVLVVFVLGIALGQALSDSPQPPSTATYVRTLEPLPQVPGTTSP